MKIFISWSGEFSKELGEVFRNWIPSVLQAVRPYFTPNDVEKGTRWSSDIASELQDSQFGIFCLTRDNITSQWIMFEAGAISKVVDGSHVCPILFELEPSDFSGPLNQFQLTKFNKEEIYNLVKSMNKQLKENSLSEKTLESVFEMWWPSLKNEINIILKKYRDESKPEIRSDRDILEEILSLSRINAKSSKEKEENNRLGNLLYLSNIYQKDNPLNENEVSEWLINYISNSKSQNSFRELLRNSVKKEDKDPEDNK